ncbi:MAG: polyprenyl synthetase family protein [Bacteroidetes bacterium]|nr:polyprenyl synthetase family protein [Bacteroidota bacterium]
MHTYNELLELFNSALLKEKFSGHPPELYDPIAYTLELGGKRMRPLLLLMSCEMFGTPPEKAVKPAIGIEVFHNFTLIHDDIMDKAPLRRGKETVYKKWDENVAILSGDTMFAIAFQYMATAETKRLRELLNVFTRTAIEVCEGQQLDMNFETTDSVHIQDYLNMIRLKTAVLLGASLKIGAIIAGADSKECDKIYNFGVQLGQAFQLKDDLLDVFGDEEKFGKVSGGDIIAGKKTFLYLKAYELAGENQKNTLNELFSLPEDKNSLRVSEVKKLYRHLNIQQETEEMIRNLYHAAMQDLKSISADEGKKTLLKEFAENLMKRDY